MGISESIKSGKLIRGGILLVLAVSPLEEKEEVRKSGRDEERQQKG